MKIFLLTILIAVTGCSHRSNTGQLWENTDQCILVEERYLDDESIKVLKTNIGDKIKYSDKGVFIICQTDPQIFRNYFQVVMCTPATLLADGAHWIAKYAIIPTKDQGNDFDDKFYHPKYFSVNELKATQSPRQDQNHNKFPCATGLELLGLLSLIH